MTGWLVSPWTWLIAAAVLAGLEIVSPGAFMIWLAGAAVVTAAVAWAFAPPLVAQSAIFVGFAMIAVLIARRWFGQRRLPADTELNQRTTRMVGALVTVLDPLIAGRGRVQVGDSPWSASCPDLPAGATARIVRVDGTTVVVEPV